MNVNVKVAGAEQFRQALTLLVKQTRQSAKTEVRRASNGTAALARKAAPKASGLLKSALAATSSVALTDDGLTGTVSIPTPSRAFVYGPFVEGLFNGYKLGRKPGRMPPLVPILEWVRIKGLAKKWKVSEKSAAFLVRRKIGKKGTPAKPFMKPASEVWIPKFTENIQRVFKQSAEQIVKLKAVTG